MRTNSRHHTSQGFSWAGKTKPRRFHGHNRGIENMPANYYPGRTTFGLLPEPEGRSASFITSAVINMTILAVALYVGMMAKHVIEQHHFEQTELIFPTTPPPKP